MKTFIFISFLILFNSFFFSQDKQREFIEALINNSENLEDFVDENELVKSKRLGISYDSVKYKFMISYDIDEKVKEEIKNNNIKYEVKTDVIDKQYSLAEFTVPTLNYSKRFYFKNGNWISPVTYFSKDWATKTSKYFVFKINEPKYFNDYCINKLDEFVDSMAVLLEFTEQQKKLLEEEKIYYILCKDEKEIEQITGFNTRGIYITAFDEVVTTYNTHYHELAHLLMNYKLKNLSLYTLPFFQEGFAVAVGGRGGIAKEVALDIGYYLQKSGFLTYDSIITNDGFYREDASLTYPVAGLYNSFLMKEMGARGYIKLYRQANGSLEEFKKIDRNQISLPDVENYKKFLKEYVNKPNIFVDMNDTHIVKISKGILWRKGTFIKVDNYYKFSVTSPFIFFLPNVIIEKGYLSKKYDEIIRKLNDDEDYFGAFMYGIAADSLSVTLYNFYTNELIASYSRNFSINPQQVPIINGRYEFFIRHDVFENDLDSALIMIGHGR